jgi:hypothetical protein
MSENIPITFKEDNALFLAMSEENMRLRARVEVLERVREAAEDVAYGYDPDRDMGAIEASVRALIKTLEAKP